MDLRPLSRAIAATERRFRASGESPTYRKAAEWFLDNYHLISRAMRQLETELPPGFRRRLPHAANDGSPRVLRIARALVESTRVDFDEATLVSFVAAFQRTAPLTIAEIWALPMMLRLVALETMVEAAQTLVPAPVPVPVPAGVLDAAVCVERCVRVLRLLADIDWRTFFQRTSVVDAALCEDPAAVYAHMAFEARDAYRKVIERFAWETDASELEVTRAALDLAAAHARDPRRGHVGYYLVDRGQAALKQRIGHRPRGAAWWRDGMLAHPTVSYLGAVGLTSVVVLGGLVPTLLDLFGALGAVAAVLLLAIPVSSIAVALTNWAVTRVLPPRTLPRLDFSTGVPDDCRTLVVVPALVADPADVAPLLAQLELHYLSTGGTSLSFALLTDFVDSPVAPDPTAILARADDLVQALNAKYAMGEVGPFHLLHREARWNPAERCHMGWERKRGKLEELNRRLRGDVTTSFTHHAGDPRGLERIRFVLTLDADTQLPLGAAQKLVGIAAHPLNRALFDEVTGRVEAGYTIVQPRVETLPADGAPSLYGWMFAGDTALDIYTHAVSDVYQDLFGVGSYVGKGIYDVDAFARSVAGCVPENALCSHDLFEGIHGRVALATDVFVLEHYPHHVVGSARRQHRWMRGDWQLLPWLLPRVRGAGGSRRANRLRVIDRWKILDNLRRSLLWPSLLCLVVVGLATLPPSAVALALCPLLMPLLVAAPSLAGPQRRQTLARWVVCVAWLPSEAWQAVDAVGRTLVRTAITRRRLLEWVTAADTARNVREGSHRLFWRQFGPASVTAVAVATAITLARGIAPWAFAPVLLLWLLAPELARRLSLPAAAPLPLRAADAQILRRLARRTWGFFETFVGPGDQWLPPDNYQVEPGGVVAHRTSPTNIGLGLVAYLSAYDFGYVGRSELRALVGHTLDTLDRLERYHGHLLNWYDTKTLEPLLPRYVSTVDSGNLAAALIVLARGCRDAATAPTVRALRCVGLMDTLDLLLEAIDGLPAPHERASEALSAIRDALWVAHERPDERAAVIARISTVEIPCLEAALLEPLAQTATEDVATLGEVRTWLLALKHQLRSFRADVEAVHAPDDALRAELAVLADRAEVMRAAMDFRFLYDEPRKLFHIGHNVTSDRLDANHYDLLESEARIASFLAVVERQVPPEHWLVLGRPITRIRGAPALLSWGGTMFEYLMPSLFMRSQPGSLLEQSAELAVAAQIDYGRATGTPWGISESAFAQRDARETYQYRSFGVPGLGIRRGLEDDLVVAPYACVLAVGLRPRATLENLAALTRLGAMGTYGLYEAVDFRTVPDAGPVVVRSHMAHHQGMILAALDNVLCDSVHVERFHAHPLVRTGTALLSERLPSVRVAELPPRQVRRAGEHVEVPVPFFPAWTPDRVGPQLALLGNGRLTTLLTDRGAGLVRWKGLAVTGVDDDPTCDVDGTWIYVRDEATGRLWSAAPAPTRPRCAADEVTFHAHEVELHHRDEGVSVRTAVAVAAHDDVEVRRITLHNESSEPRTLSLHSYAEPVLEARAAAARHPAFSRMFVQCEVLAKQHGVLAWRHKRDPAEPGVVMMQRWVWDDHAVSWLGAETDRGVFVGRHRGVRAPALSRSGRDLGSGQAGSVDPVIALGVRVTLAPGSRVELALVTAVGPARDVVLDLARRFGSTHAARWAAHDARREVARRLDREGMTPALLPVALRLVSRLLIPGAAPRSTRDMLASARPSKSDLWGHGISGDLPILVVHVRDPRNVTLPREMLVLQRALRHWQVPVDLVFLDESETGYQDVKTSGIRDSIIDLGMGDDIGRRGGVHLLARDKLTPADCARVVAAAHVVLDADAGSLSDQLAVGGARSPLPPFTGNLPPDLTSGRAPLPAGLSFANGLGGFTPDGREYVVRVEAGRPTPAPWCNVLANADLGCLVSECSLGTTWAGNSGENRLTPWRNDPVGDAPSEVLYLRDEETAQVWSTTPLPAGLEAETLVRHGAGYTVYERESHSLRQTLTVFVAVDSPVKVLHLTLTNLSARPRRLTATYYVEWVLGAMRQQQHWHTQVEYDAPTEALLATNAWSKDFAERVAFITSDRRPHGFTCDRTEFLGESGNAARPAALGRWGLSGSVARPADPCAALQTHLELAGHGSITTHFVLGEGGDRPAALALATRFRAPLEVDRARQAVEQHWDHVLGAVRVRTPEPSMDVLLNRWLPYQTLTSRFLARAGFYQASGAYGFRDQLQDTMGLVHVLPALAREHLLRVAAHQFEAGDVLHWWHPPLDRGIRTRCSDDMLWLPFVAAHYVRTTGDVGVLGEVVPFLAGAELTPEENDRYTEFAAGPHRGTLIEHCRRALVRASTEGPHGLPLMGSGDWNDGMSRVGEHGRGESVWLAWFLCATMREFATLCERTGDDAEAARWRAASAVLAARVESAAWDGDWYLRAFYDDGTALGAARSNHCRIDSIAQSWSVLSGVGDRQRSAQAVRSADAHLVREDDRLVLLLDPPFRGGLHHPGYIEAYPPGVRENGGQYTHAAVWLGWAHASLGDGAAAERIFRLLNPILRTSSARATELYRVEPYVLAADVYSVAPLTGRGGWTWYTGSSAWMWRLGVEAILGLSRRDGALFVDPCIPAHWPGFEATLRIGAQEVHVVVENPGRTGHDVETSTLDGVVVPAARVPVGDAQARRELRVVLRRATRLASDPVARVDHERP